MCEGDSFASQGNCYCPELQSSPILYKIYKLPVTSEQMVFLEVLLILTPEPSRCWSAASPATARPSPQAAARSGAPAAAPPAALPAPSRPTPPRLWLLGRAGRPGRGRTDPAGSLLRSAAGAAGGRGCCGQAAAGGAAERAASQPENWA